MIVEEGRQVSIEYTLAVTDGSTVQSNVGSDPLVYEHGQGQILGALEQALEGCGVGESVDVTIAPEDGYGHVDPEAVRQVPETMIPESAREVGTMLVASDENGSSMPVKVVAIEEGAITLDLNHPLAGETLHFAIRVVDIA